MDRQRPLYREFFDVLVKAQKERPQRQDLITGPDGYPECEWAAFERDVMLGETNRVRTERGLDPVTLTDVMDRERWAMGHADYTMKYALYCAELAVGRPERGI